MGIQVKHGRWTARLEGPLVEDLEREIRDALGPVGDVLEEGVEEVHAELLRTWPVSSGETRNSWSVTFRVDPSRLGVEAGLVSPLRKVRFIKSTKAGRKLGATRLRSPLTTEVRRPMRDKRKELQPKLRDALAAWTSEVLGE